MAINWNKDVKPAPEKQEEQALTPYQRWYKKNKERLALQRQERYKNDPNYREKCLKNASDHRKAKHREENNLPLEYSVTHAKLAEALGVSQATVRGWRTNNYFPEPKEVNGRFYFTEEQKNLLRPLAEFFKEKVRRRLNSVDKAKLDLIITVIYSNW